VQEHVYQRFRQLCSQRGLAATHQRQKIYEAVMSRPGHYSPEQVYEQVRKELPSISLATVYKNLKTFVDAGMMQELSVHHGWRVDANSHPHHHLICTRCRSVTDLDEERLEPVKLRGRLPAGFRVEKLSLEIRGVCKKCAQAQSHKH